MLDLRKSLLHFSLSTMANQHGTKLIARKNLEMIGMRKAYKTMTNGDRNRIFVLRKVFPTFAVSPNSRSPHFCLSNLFTRKYFFCVCHVHSYMTMMYRGYIIKEKREMIDNVVRSSTASRAIDVKAFLLISLHFGIHLT